MNVLFSRNGAVALSIPRIFTKRFLASTAKEKEDLDITSLEDQSVVLETSEGLSEADIERKRNRSRLSQGHRRILHDTAPCHELVLQTQDSVRYKRRMVGRYGMEAADAPIGIAWPTKEEVEDMKEYESVAYPQTIQQMWETVAKKKIEDAKAIRERDELIAKNVQKLDKWVAELNSKIAKKEEEARVARERKERLMEEVRRHFGFKISPKDERFKEMLAQKDKAEKKLKKQAKKQARDQQMLAMFAEKAASLPQKQETEDSKGSENV